MNKTVDGRCMECGLEVIPGEHSGHSAHFTGAWVCHDCGALCDKPDDEWEDGDDTALFDDGYNAGLDAGRRETAALLQVIMDDQAAKMIRLHDWAKTTAADRDSAVFGYKQGQFSQAQVTAHYVDGKATALGLALDHALLDGAQEKGECL